MNHIKFILNSEQLPLQFEQSNNNKKSSFLLLVSFKFASSYVEIQIQNARKKNPKPMLSLSEHVVAASNITKIEWRKRYLTVLGITNFSVNNYFISVYSHLWSQSFEMMCKIFAFISFIGKVAVSWPFSFWYELNIGQRTDTPAKPTNGTLHFIFTFGEFLWSHTVRPDDENFGGAFKRREKNDDTISDAPR